MTRMTWFYGFIQCHNGFSQLYHQLIFYFIILESILWNRRKFQKFAIFKTVVYDYKSLSNK